ncbi:transglutaminaseTgpA domain-containing protein [Tumidithrix elongata RA019]|uniref:TransglutaminaseTgpA domain-containing protein n=2 Tax=Tumidithrix TaxID=3088355 RepID=A0AAW9PUQ0_9CYAN|nr:transglutaminaseTgpA domain-containing protein [Tumidithrix elongata RA019]
MGASNKPLRQTRPFDALRRSLESIPLPQAEESIPLRVLVQLLVFVGIAAVDVVASTENSIWAIPLSAIGAVWGWHARHKRNVAVKFFIAIAMIVMLVVFLGDLVRQAEETRLLLARLLIQLQVLHSFDLPRRKDLGYSVVIGLILLGLAGTLSQTMIFAVWLMLFLVIVLPVLVLDHRSRLGIKTRSFKLTKIGISPLPMLGLLTVVLVLGLTIFALLPRLPGFQLRNFPVSVNLNVQRQIPAGGIVTAGRSNQQRQGAGGTNGTGGDGTGGQAGGGVELLPPIFSTEIDSTKSTQIKPELVMRVRSQAELFWRVLAYDQFTGKGWKISRNDKSQIRTLKRSYWNYEFFIPAFTGFSVNANSTQEVVQTYTIATENFPNLVPAAATPTRLFFPSEEMDLDNEGSLRAPGQLPNNLTYTVISSVPYRDRTALIKAPQEYPRPIRKYYLEIPSTISPKVKEAAAEILANAKGVVNGKPLTFDNPYDKALYLTQIVKQKYRLKEFTFNPDGSDVVSQFIAQGGGEPTHFVSTLTIMLRSLGIPARYAVGFAPGKFNPFTGLYEVQNTDAQSVVEVFFPNHGWLAFDPVPGNPLFPPSVENDRTFSALQSFWNWIASFLPPPIVGFFAVLFNSIGKFISESFTWLVNSLGALGWVGIVVGVIILFLFGLLLWALWQAVIWTGDRRRFQKLDPVQRIYYLMLQWLAEQGLPKAPHQTPQEYVAQVNSQVSPQKAEAIAAITQSYQDWRYGDRPANLAQLKSLLRKLRSLPKRS